MVCRFRLVGHLSCLISCLALFKGRLAYIDWLIQLWFTGGSIFFFFGSGSMSSFTAGDKTYHLKKMFGKTTSHSKCESISSQSNTHPLRERVLRCFTLEELFYLNLFSKKNSFSKTGHKTPRNSSTTREEMEWRKS